MLPTVAEVYTFAMFRSLERKGTARFRHKEELTILVPPYNPTVLFVPSYEPPEQFHADKAGIAPVTPTPFPHPTPLRN
jgi:hypothetical protein